MSKTYGTQHTLTSTNVFQLHGKFKSFNDIEQRQSSAEVSIALFTYFNFAEKNINNRTVFLIFYFKRENIVIRGE